MKYMMKTQRNANYPCVIGFYNPKGGWEEFSGYADFETALAIMLKLNAAINATINVTPN